MHSRTIKLLSLIWKGHIFSQPLADSDLPETLNFMIVVRTAETDRYEPVTFCHIFWREKKLVVNCQMFLLECFFCTIMFITLCTDYIIKISSSLVAIIWLILNDICQMPPLLFFYESVPSRKI